MTDQEINQTKEALRLVDQLPSDLKRWLLNRLLDQEDLEVVSK